VKRHHIRFAHGLLLALLLVLTFSHVAAKKVLYVDASVSSEPQGANKLIRIVGRVVDDNRNAVPNAEVSIQVNDPLKSNVYVSFIHTDVNGYYRDSFVLSSASAAGNYTVYVTASKPGFEDGHVQMNFVVVHPAFELAVSPQTLSTELGQPAVYNITASSTDKEIAVLLSVAGLPNETSYVFSANPIKPSAYATLTLIPSPSTPLGSYNITITGSGNVGTRSVSIVLTIKSTPKENWALYPVIAALITFVTLLSSFYYFTRMRKRAPEVSAEKPEKKYYLEGLPLESGALMSMPDHLRKTALILCHVPEATADEIALKTGRARAVESDYLNQLVTLGHIRKRRRGRRVYFYVERKT